MVFCHQHENRLNDIIFETIRVESYYQLLRGRINTTIKRANKSSRKLYMVNSMQKRQTKSIPYIILFFK